MSFLTSALGLDKTSAQKNATKDQQAVAGTATDLYKDTANGYKEAEGIYQANLPAVGNALENLSKTTTQAGRDSLVNDFGTQQRAQATDAAANASSAFPLSPDIAAGYGLDAMNHANTNTAQYDQQLNSSQGQLQAILSFLQGSQAAMPNASGLVSLGSTVMGNPAAAVTPNPILGGIGTLIGGLA